MATKAKSILSKHDHGFQKSKEEHEKVVEKAKTHVAKVQKSVVQLKAKKANDLETKRLEIEEKCLKAQEKRQQVLGKVKETATVFGTMHYQKRSQSKDIQADKAEAQN